MPESKRTERAATQLQDAKNYREYNEVFGTPQQQEIAERIVDKAQKAVDSTTDTFNGHTQSTDK